MLYNINIAIIKLYHIAIIKFTQAPHYDTVFGGVYSIISKILSRIKLILVYLAQNFVIYSNTKGLLHFYYPP